MKPQRFEIGQAVTPKRGEDWSWKEGYVSGPFPLKCGQVYHVIGHYWVLSMNDWAILVAEVGMHRGFMEYHFEPVITDSELYEALQEQPETVSA